MKRIIEENRCRRRGRSWEGNREKFGERKRREWMKIGFGEEEMMMREVGGGLSFHSSTGLYSWKCIYKVIKGMRRWEEDEKNQEKRMGRKSREENEKAWEECFEYLHEKSHSWKKMTINHSTITRQVDETVTVIISRLTGWSGRESTHHILLMRWSERKGWREREREGWRKERMERDDRPRWWGGRTMKHFIRFNHIISLVSISIHFCPLLSQSSETDLQLTPFPFHHFHPSSNHVFLHSSSILV